MTAIPRWCWPVLVLVLILDVFLRAHTFSAGIRERWGIDLDPYAGKAIEPIDCDEAVYTYAGRRILAGDVMYRDLTEPKPPGGYWLYALGVRLGARLKAGDVVCLRGALGAGKTTLARGA